MSISCKSRSSLYIGVLVVLAVIMVVGICLAAYAKPAKSVYKIGAVFSITGPAAPLGTPERDTAQLLEKQVNKAGGINGHPIKIIILDTKSKETDTLMAVNNLMDQGVLAIVGPSQTGESLAVLDAVTRAKMPLLSCAAGIKIVQPVTPWVFKTAQSDVHAVTRLVDYMLKKGFNKVAILSVSNAYGDSGKQQLELQCKKARIRVIAEESFGDNDRDMTAQLTKIRARKPQAIICWGTNPGPALVARNMKQLGMKTPLLMSHGIANKKFIELAGDAADGVIFPAGKLIVVDDIPDSDPQKPVLLAYRKAFMAEYKREPDTFGGHAYDAVKLALLAIGKAGTDRSKIRSAVENTKGFIGVSGIFKFSPNEHNGLQKSSFALVTIKNGKWRLVK